MEELGHRLRRRHYPMSRRPSSGQSKDLFKPRLASNTRRAARCHWRQEVRLAVTAAILCSSCRASSMSPRTDPCSSRDARSVYSPELLLPLLNLNHTSPPTPQFELPIALHVALTTTPFNA